MPRDTPACHFLSLFHKYKWSAIRTTENKTSHSILSFCLFAAPCNFHFHVRLSHFSQRFTTCQLVNGSAISIVTGLHIFLGHNCSLSVDATNIAYILAVFIDGQYNYEKKMFISRLTTQLQKFSNLSSHLL